MKNKGCILVLTLVLGFSAIAEQRIGFVRKLDDGVSGSFGGVCWSLRKTGAGKMIWCPSPACWIDSSLTSRTCKVWAIMPLRRVEQNDALPIWHYSQKHKSHVREPSARYQIQYSGAIAETAVTCDTCIENIFDIDAGDLFLNFGWDSNVLESVLVRPKEFNDATLDSVLCSSGRIDVDGMLLLYGLTMLQNGSCLLWYSVNGMGDAKLLDLKIVEGKLCNSDGRPIGSRPDIDTRVPGSAVWISDSDTVSLRFSYDYKSLEKSEPRSSDVHISLSNLLSIYEWLSKPQDKRGVWQGRGKCSLEDRRIF